MKIKAKSRKAVMFYIFISPWLIGFLLFSVVPMFSSLYFSFTKYNIITDPVFIGLKNYERLFTGIDPVFFKSLVNTLRFTLPRVILGLIVPLLFALLLNRDMKLKRTFRTIIYLPAIIPVVGAALIWQFLFSGDFGLFNYILSVFNIQKVEWLNYDNAMRSIILMSVWCGIGPTMTILLASLQGVSQTLYEAVTIDGANFWHKFRYVTLPMISPTLFYLLITSLISSFQVFTEMKLLTNGGPADATTTLTMQVYNDAFSNMGYASAKAWIIFLIVLVFTVFFFKYVQKFVYYEAGND
jgi:multiple sugar transport system permease protein